MVDRDPDGGGAKSENKRSGKALCGNIYIEQVMNDLFPSSILFFSVGCRLYNQLVPHKSEYLSIQRKGNEKSRLAVIKIFSVHANLMMRDARDLRHAKTG